MNTAVFGPPPPTRREGPGDKPAGLPTIIALVISYVLFILFLFCSFAGLWPRPTPSGTQTGRVTQNLSPPPSVTNLANGTSGVANRTNSATGGVAVSETRQEHYVDPQPARFFGKEFTVYNEVRLLLLVLLSGALGGSVHALRSLAWYVGNRGFVRSWVLFYCMKPFVGAGLGMIFYFVVRGGFFAPSADFSNTSPFGFCALAAMIGLFSESAVLKLKEIADTIFSRPRPGADARPQGSSNNPPPSLPAPSGDATPPRPTRPATGASNPPPPIAQRITRPT